MALNGIVATNLLESENPFQWKIGNDLETVPNDMIGRLNEKLLDTASDDDNPFSNAVLSITLAYEYFLAEKLKDALRVLSEIRKVLKTEDDATTEKWMLAVRHTIISSQVYILLHDGDLDAAYEKSRKIPSVSEMNESNRAALLGLRAAYCAEYGLDGTKLALNYAIQALEKDPHNFLWYFLKGKLLGRVRRVEKPFDIPSKVELEALETALQKAWHPACVLFMAELYRETAYRVFKKHRNDKTLFAQLKSKIDEMNAKSRDLYRKSIELKPSCARVMFRCAKGFIKLPNPYRDDKLAKELLEDGLKINPNSAYGNHVIAQFYERREKNVHLAMKYLQICVDQKVYGACIDLLKLEFHQRLITTNELLSRLEKIYEEFPENPRRCQTLSQLASYYVLVESNLAKACEYIVQIFRMNPQSDDVLKHRPIFYQILDTVSLVDILVDEIKIRLRDPNCHSEREIYERFFDDLRELDIPVSNRGPMYLKEQLLYSPEVGKYGIPRRCGPSRVTLLNMPASRADKLPELKKVRNFIDSWKREVTLQWSNRNLSEIGVCDSVSKHLTVVANSESQLDKKIYRHTTKREKKSEFDKMRNLPNDSRNAAHSAFREEDNISGEFENLLLRDAESNFRSDDRKNAFVRPPSDDSDSDFENSVRVYRESKQNLNTKTDPLQSKRNTDRFSKKQFKMKQSTGETNTVCSSQNVREINSNKRTSKETRKNKNEGCTLGEFKHQVVVEQLAKKFEPKMIEF